MTPNEAERRINGLSQEELTPALVVLAKAYLIANVSGDTFSMVEAFTRAMGYAKPEQVVVGFGEETALLQTARWLAHRAAASEAIWALIGAGVLVAIGPQDTRPAHLDWREGNTSSGWDFGNPVLLPTSVRLTAAASGNTTLTDGDLFMWKLELASLDDEIDASLRAAVDCFRHDLYLPAQVMIGRAFEGAWTRLAQAIAIRKSTDPAQSRLVKELDAGTLQLGKLLTLVPPLLEGPELGSTLKRLGITKSDVRSTVAWTDTLRESRNAVHPGADAPLEATWETTAALLLGTALHMRRIWNLQQALRPPQHKVVRRPANSAAPS